MRKNPYGDSFDDRGIKNKFRWAWLDEVVKHKDGSQESLKEGVIKVDTPGLAICSRCNGCKPMQYGSRGKIVFMKHATTDLHYKNFVESSKNAVFPGRTTISSD